MNSSDFILAKDSHTSKEKNCGKAITSVVVIDGKNYFKKQLAESCKNDLRHRMAMYKEFDAGRQISSPHIVKYVGINEDEQGLYVLMEHINGMSMAEKMETEPAYFRNQRNTVKMLKQLLEALKALHSKNIAYLDLKPENIMLTQISNDVKLTDLGGCFADCNDYTAESTHKYAAPELIEERLDDVDARTDIYGIGKLLEYIEQKTEKKLPKHLSNIMKHCLHEDKAKRYATADEVIKALNRRDKIAMTILLTITILSAALYGWKQFEGTEEHRLLVLEMRKDATIDGIHYKITSEDNATCMVIGAQMGKEVTTDFINLYIRDSIKIDGKTYHTTEIEDCAFKENMIAITSAFLPNSLGRIGEEAFLGCTQLTNLSIPEGMTKTEFASFKRTGIKNVLLSKNLEIVGHASFAECCNLKTIHIPEGVVLLELDAFACCFNLTGVSMPSTLKEISRGVFWECKSLKEIDIPANVTTIGEYAFYRCDSLKDVYNYSIEPQTVSVIFNRKDINIHVPAASVDKYRKAHHWKEMNIIGDL
ncbi:MAG: leucine-rich repeat protein [Bacteroidales bacterium]|nr:leucine-rich repeat protein [Bacteroidales bacterium]